MRATGSVSLAPQSAYARSWHARDWRRVPHTHEDQFPSDRFHPLAKGSARDPRILPVSDATPGCDRPGFFGQARTRPLDDRVTQRGSPPRLTRGIGVQGADRFGGLRQGEGSGVTPAVQSYTGRRLSWGAANDEPLSLSKGRSDSESPLPSE